MAEAQQPDEKKQGGGASKEPESPTKEPPRSQAAAPPPSPPAPPAVSTSAPAEQPKPTSHVPTRRLIGEDDEIPDDAELLEMPKKALKSRLARHTKTELKSRFGTDDFDEIKTRLDKLADFEKKQEEQRLAQLTETDRLKEQLTAAERRFQDAEKRAERAQLQRVLDTEDRRAAKILSRYIDDDDIEDVIPRLARHINGLSDDECVNPDAVIDAWAKDFVEKKPKFAKNKPEEKREAKPPPERVPLTNGPPAGGKPSGSLVPNLGEKTAAPGKPNSMTQAEWLAYKRQNNLNF
jgi:hypothetical protein